MIDQPNEAEEGPFASEEISLKASRRLMPRFLLTGSAGRRRRPRTPEAPPAGREPDRRAESREL